MKRLVGTGVESEDIGAISKKKKKKKKIRVTNIFCWDLHAWDYLIPRVVARLTKPIVEGL